MPMSDGHYVAPTWVNYGPPALDADELNAISGTLENLDLSQGDIAAPYSKMGLTGTPTIGASLGVLANIGNVHVWRKTVTTEEEVPAKYELGPVQTNVEIIRSGATHPAALKPTAHYTATINVDDGGNLSLESPRDYSAQSNGAQWGHLWADGATVLVNKFVTFSSDEYQSSQVLDGFWFIPSDATFSTENTDEYTITQVSKIQRVTGRALIPPGTHITYLTSTNRNAYQEGDNEVPAKYELGPIIEESYKVVGLSSGQNQESYRYGDTPQVSIDGVILPDSLKNGITLYCTAESANTANSTLRGKFLIRPGSFSNANFPVNKVVFIPLDALFTYNEGGDYYLYLDKYQEVIGVPGIPANTFIEYLGVLGDKVTIVEGSYTLSRGETKKINLGFRPQIVMLYRNGTNTETASDLVLTSSRYVAFDNYNQYSVDFTMLSNGFSTQWEQSREDDPYTIDYKAISGGLIE